MPQNLTSTVSGKLATLVSGCGTHPIIDSMPAVNTDGDSTEELTILGSKRANPYTVANMAQAYNNLGLSNVTVAVTNQYVRFLPASPDQLPTLDSTMDSQGIELFDTPMDYDVLKDGDYYQDPSIPDSMVTWQYAVVPTNFVAPAGFTYQVLSQIHIPTDTYVAVETEAERLASIQDSIACSGGAAPAIVAIPNVPQCGTGYHWDYTLRQCVCDCCPAGYHWDGTKCVINTPPPPPPPPSPDQTIPAGTITVHDTQLTGPINGNFGVRNARVVAKRWFKIERVYTDNTGHFQCTKRFKHKVKIIVKFKNDDAQVRNLNFKWQFWQGFLPVTYRIGVFSGNKSSVNYNFNVNGIYTSKANIYWASATVHNAIQEYKDLAMSEGTGLPATGLRILINRSTTAGITLLFHKRYVVNFSNEIALFAISPVADLINNVVSLLKKQVDVSIGWGYGSTAALHSDNIKTTIYHELTHTAQYANLGNSWYSSLFDAEARQIIAHLFDSNKPYGTSTSSDAPLIALGESWAYYMGHYFADKTYSTAASCQLEQPGSSFNCNFTGTGHPHIDVEENFNPNLGTDPFKWIPQGVYQDLRDNTNETGIPVIDQVSAYTNQQMFNAFQPNIYTLQDYKLKLLQTTSNSTSSFVPNLFAQYHY